MAGDTDVARRVPPAALETWTADVLVRLGASADHGASVARVLVDATARGVDSHGVARLPMYVRLIDRGLIDLDAKPSVDRRSGATALIDAANSFGQPAGELGMQEAVGLAREYGVGWSVVRRSNHYGTVGYYARMAAEQGLVALAATNSASVVAPTRASGRFLGTNPLAFGAPVEGGAPVVLDMSTSTVSGGKLEVAMRDGKPIPEGWGVTAEGVDTTDPYSVFRQGGALRPLGGDELHSGYKGFGLALMVETLTAILANGAFARGVGALTSAEPTQPADVSHFAVVLDPARFGTGADFGRNLAELCAQLRALPPVDPELPVLIPGDPEEHALRERTELGIPLSGPVEQSLAELADRTGAPLPEGLEP